MGLHPERTACVRDAEKKKTRCATCPPQVRVRARRGEEKTRCATCPPQVRVRARREEERDTVRDLPGAAAQVSGGG